MNHLELHSIAMFPLWVPTFVPLLSMHVKVRTNHSPFGGIPMILPAELSISEADPFPPMTQHMCIHCVCITEYDQGLLINPALCVSECSPLLPIAPPPYHPYHLYHLLP